MNRLNKILITGLFTVVCFSGCQASDCQPKTFGTAMVDFFASICPTSVFTRAGSLGKINTSFATFCNIIASEKYPSIDSDSCIDLQAIYGVRKADRHLEKPFDPNNPRDPKPFYSDEFYRTQTREKKQKDICRAFRMKEYAEKEAPETTRKTIFAAFKDCVKVSPNNPERRKECFNAFGSNGIAGMFGHKFARKMETCFKDYENEL